MPEESNSLQLQIRSARPEDMDGIEALIKAAVEQMRKEGIKQWDECYPAREHLEEDLRARTLWVAELDGRLAASVTLDGIPDSAYSMVEWIHPARRPLYVHRLCVHPDVQGRKIARGVMGFAEHIARNQKFDVIRLDAFELNPRANRLYSSLSYGIVGPIELRMGRFICYEKVMDRIE